jgi:hypothetical protein
MPGISRFWPEVEVYSINLLQTCIVSQINHRINELYLLERYDSGEGGKEQGGIIITPPTAVDQN